MKKRFLIPIVLIVLVVVACLFANNFIENKIKNKLPSTILEGDFTYKNIEVNTFSGNVKLEGLNWKRARDTSQVQLQNVQVKGLSYYNYFFEDKISVDQLIIENPIIEIQKKVAKDSVKKPAKKPTLKQAVFINELLLKNGKITQKRDSVTHLSVRDFHLTLENISINEETLAAEIPFKTENYQLEAKEIFMDAGDLQTLEVKDIQLDAKNIAVVDLFLKPKYSKTEYIQHIPYEKDIMTLKIPSIKIQDYEFVNDSVKQFEAKMIVIDQLFLDIYRDKTVNDDLREKPLYSKMLRDLEVKLKIDSVNIKNSFVDYQERIRVDAEPGRVFFDPIEFEIANVTNIDLDREDFPETKVKITTKYMGVSPLDFNWSFKVNDTLDRFKVYGAGFNIPEESINSFFVPAFNMKAEGHVKKAFYNYTANPHQASGDFKIEYDKFKLVVLKKEEKKKSKVLSFIANLVVKNKTDEGGTEEKVEAVQRDKTKSFWNFFWKFIEGGLKKVLL
ncbi:hypothetical protein [Mesonia sp. K7]|uniref:hypothetical protein n=1 Tax=Mesonia sp. K7 TaxID=2218606 RepID=UPI000DA7E752|nr:hypothetical protein [Mesonia sp. K7]PZD78783.1 hypothetical protein DNG35_04845 [Mesonia sp. K7]